MNVMLIRHPLLRLVFAILIGAVAHAQSISVTSIRRINPPATGIDQIRGKPGDQVEILGSNLNYVRQVQFGLGTATFAANATRLVAIIPPSATIGSISLYDSFGLAYGTFFNFQLAPRITAYKRVQPTANSPAEEVRVVPGNSVRFEGNNFVDNDDATFVTRVYFPYAWGGYVAAKTEFASSTSMQVTVPTGAVSGVPVLVNPAGSVDNLGKLYLQPVISGFSPSSARVGDSITVQGYSLLDTTSVLFGNVAATPTSVTATNLVVVVPAIKQSVPLTVNTPGGVFLTVSNLLLLPRITTFFPSAGAPGDVVTLSGDGLSGTTGVSFGGVAATVLTNVSSSQVTAVVPPGAFSGSIRITTALGSDVSAQEFVVAPVVTDIQPAEAKPGAGVVLVGSNLGGVTRVEFAGGIAAIFTIDASNRITATVPLGAVSGPIRVTNPGGTSTSTRSFTVASILPQIVGFVPAYGPPGTSVRIGGDNLSTATAVRFNGVPVAGFSVVSDTQINAVVPAGATSGRITVITGLGTATSRTDFLVGNNANLSVAGQANPSEPLTGEEVAFTFQCANGGPIPATATTLTVTLPDSAGYLGASSSSGSFDTFGSAVVFNAGTLQPGASLLATVRLRFPGISPATVSAVAVSDMPDPDTTDNTVRVVVRPSRPTVGYERLSDGRFAVTWAGSVTGAVLQQAGTPNGPWANVPGTPETTPLGKRLVLDPSASARFYRLSF